MQKDQGPNLQASLLSFSLLGREDVVLCWPEPGGDLWGQPTLCMHVTKHLCVWKVLL